MPMNLQVIQELIEQGIPGAEVHVKDLVGDGDHLQAVVVSKDFEGKSLLQQHQIVYGTLKDVLKADLHALALKTYTPEKYTESTK